MEKKRFVKTLSIVALVIAIAGMTLGFAAFSKVLTITSSAKVTPSQDDFKITLYGATSLEHLEKMLAGEDIDFENDNWSTTEAYQINANQELTGKYTAVLGSSDTELSISNIGAEFLDSGTTYYYAFGIKNDGYYDASISFDESSRLTSYGNCTTDVTEDASIVEGLCSKIISTPSNIFDSSYNDITSQISTGITLAKGDYLLFVYTIANNNTTSFVEAGLSSGFDISFDDFVIQFASVA